MQFGGHVKSDQEPRNQSEAKFVLKEAESGNRKEEYYQCH